jgi:hypothetical protein
MRSKLLNADPPITYAVVLDTGGEVIGELGKFVREQEVEAASLTAIGAFSRAVIGFSSGKPSNTRKSPSTSKSRSCRCSAMSQSATKVRRCIYIRFSAKPTAVSSAVT